MQQQISERYIFFVADEKEKRHVPQEVATEMPVRVSNIC